MYRWAGTDWQGLAQAIGGSHDAAIHGMTVHGDDLILAGEFYSFGAATSRSIVRWHTCLADANCDGAATLQDIFDFLAAWFSQSASADINTDGAVTLQDLFDFLGFWFAGC